MCLSSEILDDRVCVSVEGSQASSLGGPWAAVRCKQRTDTVLLFAVSKGSFKVWNQSNNKILSVVLPSLQKEWKFVKYACNWRRRGALKLQTGLLKTAWAAFVWTCKTQQLNASFVCRGKYANSKHISHQKPFQACHRWDMKDDKSGEQGRPVLWERGCGHCALNAAAEPAHPWRPGPARFPWAPPARPGPPAPPGHGPGAASGTAVCERRPPAPIPQPPDPGFLSE